MTNTPQKTSDADMLKALTAAIQDCDSVVVEKLNALFAMDTQKFGGDVARALIASAEAMTDFPKSVMIWHSSPNLTHCGTWSTERYPENAVEYRRVEANTPEAPRHIFPDRGAGEWVAYEDYAALQAVARESAMQELASLSQAQEAYAAQVAAEAERDALKADVDRLIYVLGGVRAAILTGRNEPLQIWKEQVDIALEDRA